MTMPDHRSELSAEVVCIECGGCGREMTMGLYWLEDNPECRNCHGAGWTAREKAGEVEGG